MIDQDGVAFSENLDLLTRIFQVTSNAEPTPRLHRTVSHTESSMQRGEEKTGSFPAESDDPEPAKNAVARISARGSTCSQTR